MYARYSQGGKFKEWNAKSRIEKSSFFNEISLEYKETKLPQNYMERKKSQASLTETLNAKFLSNIKANSKNIHGCKHTNLKLY